MCLLHAPSSSSSSSSSPQIMAATPTTTTDCFSPHVCFRAAPTPQVIVNHGGDAARLQLQTAPPCPERTRTSRRDGRGTENESWTPLCTARRPDWAARRRRLDAAAGVQAGTLVVIWVTSRGNVPLNVVLKIFYWSDSNVGVNVILFYLFFSCEITSSFFTEQNAASWYFPPTRTLRWHHFLLANLR